MWDGRVRYLSDRGIKQAVERGLLCFDPPLEDRQIQPASVDLLLDRVEEVFPLHEHFLDSWKWPEENDLVPGRSDAELWSTQKMFFAPGLKFHTELRSSLRRLSCYVGNNGATTAAMNRVYVEMHNPSDIGIKFASGDKIAQLMFFFFKADPKAEFAEPALYETYRLLDGIDSGRVIYSAKEAKFLMAQGYFSVPDAKFWRGSLEVHAGSKARVLRKKASVNLSNSRDISGCFEEVSLPYKARPNEHVVVETREHLELSAHVGIHFHDYLPFSRRAFSFSRHCPERIFSDVRLAAVPDGWVDPGYRGVFSRQPKTFYEKGVLIRPGQLLGHGTIVFFPEGVERPYGSDGLGSHYQNSKDVKLVQNK